MVVRTIRILTDKSSTAHHHADALAKGVRDSGSLFNVAVGDLARTPSDAFYGETALEDIRLNKSDVLLFSSTGALSLYEKHFEAEEGRHPLHSKTIGIVLFPRSTFDEPDTTHPIDQHLIETLNEYGLERDAILLQAKSDNDDQELYTLGKRFAEQLE